MKEELVSIDCICKFDSLVASIPDLRAGTRDERHLIYEGGGVIFSLLVKPAENSTSMEIGGQVLPQERTLDCVSNVTVSLQQGKKATYTRTNALGEFTFNAIPSGPLDLSITLGNCCFNIRGLSKREPDSWEVIPSAVQGER